MKFLTKRFNLVRIGELSASLLFDSCIVVFLVLTFSFMVTNDFSYPANLGLKFGQHRKPHYRGVSNV